jgi:hypothetical protein
MEWDELQRLTATTLERLGIPYFFTGSVASMFYGETRFTNDLDVVIDLQPEQVDALVASFDPDEFYVSEDAVRQALRFRSQFNVIHPATAFKIDFIIPKNDGYDHERLRRAVRVRPGPDFEAFVSSAEDIILAKMLFFQEGESDKHLRDIASVLKISGASLDYGYIASRAAQRNVSDIWNAILAKTEPPRSNGLS